MATTGTLELDIRNYDAGLYAAQEHMKTTAKSISSSGSIVAALGGEISGAFGKAGSAISAISGAFTSVASGAIAAIGLLVAAGVKLWDEWTLSAEEYAEKARIAMEQADKARQKLEAAQSEDSGYMARLQELAEKEQLSNAAKAEAARLIEILNSKYGDLGLSIDDLTGKIKGADEAQKKLLERMAKQKEQAIKNQFKTSSALTSAQMREAMGTNSTQYKAIEAEQNFRAVRSLPLQQQLGIAQSMLGRAKTQKEIQSWKTVVDGLEKQIELQNELNTLREKGAVSEKEIMDRKRVETDKAQKKLEEENAKRKKEADDLRRKAEEEAAARAKGIENLNRAISGKADSLYERALRMSGRGKEADQRAALRDAEKTKGADLTDAEKSSVLKLAELSWQMSQRNIPRLGDLSVRTNALTARGGFQGGALMPDALSVNKAIADYNKQQTALMQQANGLLRELGGKVESINKVA